MGSSAAAIYCFVSLLSLVCSARAQAIWQLNTSYTVSQPNLTQQYGPWSLDQYPGSLAFIVLGQTFSDVSIYLCLLSSPSPSSPPSMQNLSFTLSIYMYSSSIYGGAIVWTANRLQAISASQVSLTLRTDGNLVLTGDDLQADPIWSSNTANRGVATMEIAQNPASLIMRNASGSAVWQSTDYPTDTMTSTQFLLPGQSLTSWASATDPSPGAYKLVMEPSGLALYMGLQSPEPYWIWSFYGINDSLSVMRTCEQSLLAAFMDPEGALMISSNFPGSPVPVNSSYYWQPFCSAQTSSGLLPFKQYATAASVVLSNSTFLQLQHDGNLRVYSLGSVWSVQLDILNADSCLLPDYCGPYGVCLSGSQCSCTSNDSFFLPINTSDFSSGCALKSELLCNDQSLKKQTMLQLSGVDYVGNSYTPSLNISTMEECVNGCAQNCSCLAAFWRRDVNACHHIDEVRSLRGSLDQSTYFAYVKVNKLPPNGKKTAIIVATTVSTAVLLSIIVLLVLYRRRKRLVEDDDEEDTAFVGTAEGFPTRYTYKDLQQITNDFEKQLGKGGFGAVYVGQLADGTRVAVKRLESFNQGFKEFTAEVKIMAGISHYNLLRLRGFCAQKGHKLLVYDYMENGSLDQWLFTEAEKKAELTWNLRCSITLGIARGLAYLHHESREKVIHLDIKPQNILLDEMFEAKVADFGLSRLISKSESQVMTTLRGTPGYISPDWLKEGVIDEKSDVFSFGMMLMEIISGRRNLDHSVEAIEKVYYPEWAFWQAQGADFTLLTDAVLRDADDEVQLRRMINTAFLCVLEDPASRPSMRDVVLMLQGLVRIQEVRLSDLHQGLLFVLRNPSSFAKLRVDEALKSLMEPISETDPLLLSP